MKLRIKFSKIGPLKFIGHLDILRYFQKAVKRADIDIKYTEGFSPHQIMSFAFPMGIGLEGLAEYFDIEVNSMDSLEKMKEDLNAQMAYGVAIEDIIELPEKSTNAMASVKAAGYIIRFKEEPGFDVAASIKLYQEKDEVLFTKKTKKSEETKDIKPFIYEIKMASELGEVFLSDVERRGFTISKDDFYVLVNASSSGNLNPKEAVKCLYILSGLEPKEDFNLLRTDLYTEGEDGFISLGDVK